MYTKKLVSINVDETLSVEKLEPYLDIDDKKLNFWLFTLANQPFFNGKRVVCKIGCLKAEIDCY